MPNVCISRNTVLVNDSRGHFVATRWYGKPECDSAIRKPISSPGHASPASGSSSSRRSGELDRFLPRASTSPAAREGHAPQRGRQQHYPDRRAFGTLPAYGFACRRVKGLSLSGIDVRTTTPDLRHAVVCDDAQDPVLDELSVRPSAGAAAVVRMQQVCGALVRGCRLRSPAETFLSLPLSTGFEAGCQIPTHFMAQATT